MQHIKREISNALTFGTIPQDIEQFQKHLKECSECSSFLQKELDLNELLFSTAAETILTDNEWEESLNKVIPNAQDDMPKLSADEWDDLFQKAWRKSNLAKTEKNDIKETTTKIVPIKKWKKPLFSIAASLVCLLGAYIVFNSYIATENLPTTVLVTDSQLTQPILKEPSIKQKRDSLLTINKNSIAVITKTSKLRFTKRTEKEVVVVLSKGAALFSVTPKKYNKFIVKTPDAEIRVTGTIFDVLFENGRTSVSVLKGSVEVLYTDLKDKLIVAKNEKVSRKNRYANTVKIEKDELAYLFKSLKIFTDAITQINVAPVVKKMRPTETAPVKTATDFNKILKSGFSTLSKDNPTEALKLFEKVKTSSASSGVIQTAWFQAATIKLNNLNQTENGISDLKEYVKIFKKPIFHEEALIEIIHNAKLKKDIDAILTYEKSYLTSFISGGEAKEYLYEVATTLRVNRNNYKEAQTYYKLFWDKFSSDYRAEDALFWSGKCFTKLSKKSEATKKFKLYLKKYPQGRWVKEVGSLVTQ